MGNADKGRAYLDKVGTRLRPAAGATGNPKDEWPPALDLEALAERDPTPPQFILADWLPCGYGTLLAGHGGVGKSGIALHMAVCIAAGRPFFDVDLERRRVLYLSCEDRTNVLHWRLTRICRYVGLDLAQLRGWLEVIDLVGQDTVLWQRDPQTGFTTTPGYATLDERVQEHETEVLVVDGVADTYGGNENARTEVKQYVNALVRLIPEDRGAVLLVGHIAKLSAASKATSEGYSGSTAWHNSVRARWYLYPETAQESDSGGAERTRELLLDLQKSNLGRTDQRMRFHWDEDAHLFVGERVDQSHFDRKQRDREEQEGIRQAIKACMATGNYVPAAMSGPRTALKALTPELYGLPKALTDRAGKRRFWGHIEELRAMRQVREDTITRKSDRHAVRVIVLTEEGMRACGP